MMYLSLKQLLKLLSKRILTFILTATVGSSILAVYLIYYNQSHQTASERTPTVSSTSKNGLRAITDLGRVEPQGEVIKISGPLEERIGRLVVKEGQYVKTGDVLAYLESYEERLAEKKVAANWRKHVLV
jgi:HlyD family secretion protein